MTYFTWQPEYSVGHPVLDHDHQRLGDIINTLHDAVDQHHGTAVVSRTLSALRRYVESHFAREERLLRAAGYHDCDDHFLSHRSIEQTLEDFENLHSSSPEQLDSEMLLAFLKTWLLHHILEDDMNYRPLMERYILSQIPATSLMNSGTSPLSR